jgi:hypothetical protein
MFRYKITYFDEIDKEVLTENGIVAGETYGEAADRLVEIYGKENINVIGLYELDDWLTDEQLSDELKDSFNF